MGKNQNQPKTKQCKFCRSEIDKKAKVCPVCQRVQGAGKGCLIFAIIVFVIIGGIVATAIAVSVSVGGNKSSDQDTKTTYSQSADSWEEFDNKSWKQFAQLYKNHNNLLTSMTNYDNGIISASGFYAQCENLRDNFRKISTSLNYGTNSEEEAYLSVLESWALYGQRAAQDLMDYIDTLKPSKLSSAQSNIQNAKKAVSIAANNRGKLLAKTNLTNEQIKSKIEKDMEALN